MNDVQALFGILFAVYFTVLISTAGRYHPFDTSAVFAGDRRALWRLGVAFLFLNLLPFMYFSVVLDLLERFSFEDSRSWAIVLGLLFATLADFASYRFFVSIVLLRRKNQADHFVFYSTRDDLRNQFAANAAEHRQPPQPTSIPSRFVAYGGLAWFAGCILLSWLMLRLA